MHGTVLYHRCGWKMCRYSSNVMLYVVTSVKGEKCVGKKGGATGPSCRQGTYQSRRVWSRGQRPKESVGGALELAKFAPAVCGTKDVGVVAQET